MSLYCNLLAIPRKVAGSHLCQNYTSVLFSCSVTFSFSFFSFFFFPSILCRKSLKNSQDFVYLVN